MANKNIQMHQNNNGTWDNLYPYTRAENILDAGTTFAKIDLSNVNADTARGNIGAIGNTLAGVNSPVGRYYLGAGVNKNLLDNANFMIWQRYPSATFTGTPDRIVLADRWRFRIFSQTQCTFSRYSAGGIVAGASNVNCRISQRIFHTEFLRGRTLTLSAFKNTGFYTQTITAGNDWTDDTDVLDAFSNTQLKWLFPGDILYAIKLEVGDKQTLAVQWADGTWHFPEVCSYAEELQKAKLWYRNYTMLNIPFGNADGTTTIIGYLPEDFIKIGSSNLTKSQSGNMFAFYGNNNYVKINSFTVVPVDGALKFTAVTASAVPQNGSGIMYIPSVTIANTY